MSKKLAFLLSLVVCILALACKGDAKKATTPAADQPQTTTETSMPADKTNPEPNVPASGKPKYMSIDTNSSAGRANYDKPTSNTPLPIVSPEKLSEKPIGPPGFVTKDGAILYAQPSSKSAHIATMKRSENVYILQTSMMDEDGKEQPYPTWFKVQRKNKEKQTGWVMGKQLDSGGGG
ncbi:MAG: hypothetical protein JNM22_04965 [Saprospiraceae bacterium]|nr:hypothetical protein [Saprospiraceae bacterium]